MTKFVKTFNHGTEQIQVPYIEAIAALGKPIINARWDEAHFKEDATVTNGPGLCLVLTIPSQGVVLTQFSLDTLQEVLNDFGYHILPKEAIN